MKAFAVFGDPINHSLSPRIHNNAIQALNLQGFYTRYHLKNAEILREKIFDLKINGANITLPFKEKALEIADFADEMAKNIGSANTLLVKDRKIHAFNTDGIGFLAAVAEFKDLKSALILGAGGTAKAIAFSLKKSGIKVSVANRSATRLKDFNAYENYLYENLAPKNFDIVINTTSAGLKDENLPCEEDLLKSILKQANFAFEVIYGKKTPFFKLANNILKTKFNDEIRIKDGKEMLLWQGVFAFELFWEIVPNFNFLLNFLSQNPANFTQISSINASENLNENSKISSQILSQNLNENSQISNTNLSTNLKQNSSVNSSENSSKKLSQNPANSTFLQKHKIITKAMLEALNL